MEGLPVLYFRESDALKLYSIEKPSVLFLSKPYFTDILEIHEAKALLIMNTMLFLKDEEYNHHLPAGFDRS